MKKKVRFREIKWLAWGGTASKYQNQDLNLNLFDPKIIFVITF